MPTHEPSRRALYTALAALAWLMGWLGFQGGDSASSPVPSAVTELPADYRSVAATRPVHLRPVPETTTTTTLPPTTTTATTPVRPPSSPSRPAASRQAASSPADCSGHLAAVQARWPADQHRTACRIIACESGGSPTARNPHSSASGIWQFLSSTWNGYGGYAEAYLAPTAVQHDAAFALWQRSGWRPWSCA